MLEKPIPEQDKIPDVFELTKRVNEPFQKREARMNSVPATSTNIVEPEPMPTKNELPYMWPKAIERIMEVARQRDDFGAKKYGTRLQPFNGRDPLVDGFQELLDALVYIEQELFERPYKEAVITAALKIVRKGTMHPDHERHINELFEAGSVLLDIDNTR